MSGLNIATLLSKPTASLSQGCSMGVFVFLSYKSHLQEPEDLPVMQEKQPSFPQRGIPGTLVLQEMMGSQDREVNA